MGCFISSFDHYEYIYQYEEIIKIKFMNHNKSNSYVLHNSSFTKLANIAYKYIYLLDKYYDMKYFAYIDVLNQIIDMYIELHYDKLISSIHFNEDKFILKLAKIEKELLIFKINKYSSYTL